MEHHIQSECCPVVKITAHTHALLSKTNAHTIFESPKNKRMMKIHLEGFNAVVPALYECVRWSSLSSIQQHAYFSFPPFWYSGFISPLPFYSNILLMCANVLRDVVAVHLLCVADALFPANSTNEETSKVQTDGVVVAIVNSNQLRYVGVWLDRCGRVVRDTLTYTSSVMHLGLLVWENRVMIVFGWMNDMRFCCYIGLAHLLSSLI